MPNIVSLFNDSPHPSCRWQTLVWARWAKGWWMVAGPGSTSPPPVAQTSTWLQRCGVDWPTRLRQTSSRWAWCSGLSWRESPLWRKAPRRSSWVGVLWRVSSSGSAKLHRVMTVGCKAYSDQCYCTAFTRIWGRSWSEVWRASEWLSWQLWVHRPDGLWVKTVTEPVGDLKSLNEVFQHLLAAWVVSTCRVTRRRKGRHALTSSQKGRARGQVMTHRTESSLT